MHNKFNYLYRVAVAKTIDKLFYQPGDSNRCHRRANELFTRQLCGIGHETHWDYVNYPKELLAGHVLFPYILLTLTFMVTLVKAMPVFEGEQVLNCLCQAAETAVEQTQREGKSLNARMLADHLIEALEKMPVK